MNTQLLNSTVQSITTAQPIQSGSNADAGMFVNDLFKSLQVAYPAWKQAFGTEQDLKLTKKSWIRAFAESGITRKEQVALGMKRARQDESDFFPSSGKFITWCKPLPEDFGLLSSAMAWRELCDNCHRYTAHKWSSAAVYEAGKRVQFFNVKRGAVREKEFSGIYLSICEEVMLGKVFSGPNTATNAIEMHRNGKPVKTEKNLSKGNAELLKLKGMFR
jgi:hypothetical protein